MKNDIPKKINNAETINNINSKLDNPLIPVQNNMQTIKTTGNVESKESLNVTNHCFIRVLLSISINNFKLLFLYIKYKKTKYQRDKINEFLGRFINYFLGNNVWNSLGIGALKVYCLLLYGCVNVTKYECKPSLLIGLVGSPYLSSPITK